MNSQTVKNIKLAHDTSSIFPKTLTMVHNTSSILPETLTMTEEKVVLQRGDAIMEIFLLVPDKQFAADATSNSVTGNAPTLTYTTTVRVKMENSSPKSDADGGLLMIASPSDDSFSQVGTSSSMVQDHSLPLHLPLIVTPPMTFIPFSCSTCGKSFEARCVLKRHEAIHEGDLRCGDAGCEVTFRNQTTLTKHRIDKHGLDRPNARKKIGKLTHPKPRASKNEKKKENEIYLRY